MSAKVPRRKAVVQRYVRRRWRIRPICIRLATAARIAVGGQVLAGRLAFRNLAQARPSAEGFRTIPGNSEIGPTVKPWTVRGSDGKSRGALYRRPDIESRRSEPGPINLECS